MGDPLLARLEPPYSRYRRPCTWWRRFQQLRPAYFSESMVLRLGMQGLVGLRVALSFQMTDEAMPPRSQETASEICSTSCPRALHLASTNWRGHDTRPGT
jgi:hypothetical protein